MVSEEYKDIIDGVKEILSDLRKFSGSVYNGVVYLPRKLSPFSMKFYDGVNSSASFLYRQVKRLDYSVPREEALGNLDEFAEKVDIGSRLKRRRGGKEQPLEKRLATFGRHYVPAGDFEGIRPQFLWALALEYDRKGIIAREDEDIGDLAYRGNTMLLLHRTFRKGKIRPRIELDTKNWDVSLEIRVLRTELIKQEDIEEANSRIPYGMDLSWVAGFIGDGTGVLSGAYGACFTLPKYGGLSFLVMRERYKSRENFMKVLSHEMAHMGTVYLDSRKDFLETKAYAVGSAAFGEHTIALNKRPNFLFRIAKSAIQGYFHIPISEAVFRMIPKVISAVSIAENRSLYGKVRDRLHTLYGEDRGNYVLGRLTADEIEEFGYTNNVLTRVDEKKDLKWRIIKEKLESW